MLKLKTDVRLVDDRSGTFLLDTRRGVYWHLNSVAMTLVRTLTHVGSMDDAVERVVAEFDVDAATVRGDVENLVRDLKRAKLVEESS